MIPALAVDIRKLMGASIAISGSVRLGVDVVDVPAFARILNGSGGDDFAARSFTPTEIAFCAGRPARLAARWAAKEAVAKAIGTGFRGLAPRHIEVTHHPDGHPTVAPSFGEAWPNDAASWLWSVSLSHEGDAAVALVAAVTQEGGVL